MRTDAEVLSRINLVRVEDVFGFKREVLIMSGLTFEAAIDFRADAATKADWPGPTEENVTKAAREYLEFAIGKALDHRGLSAGRSCEKLTEFAWLLGLDGTVKAMADSPYPQYGVPVLYQFAKGAGMLDLWRLDDKQLANMLLGKPCQEDCMEGCVE